MSNILIVDDDLDFVNATQIVLEQEGHHVNSARGGNEGFQLALDNQPDLVILDVMMDSVLDGISACWNLHTDPATSEIPIVMVTSIANTDYAELFPTDEYIHIDSFLSKPISPDNLIKKVQTILT